MDSDKAGGIGKKAFIYLANHQYEKALREVQSSLNFYDNDDINSNSSEVHWIKGLILLAMKKEKAAYRLYLDLAMVAEAEELTDLFLALAREEANHKLRFEIEYDKNILGQG